MTEWQPQQQGLRELLFLLGQAANPNSRDQGLINQVNSKCWIQHVVIQTKFFSKATLVIQRLSRLQFVFSVHSNQAKQRRSQHTASRRTAIEEQHSKQLQQHTSACARLCQTMLHRQHRDASTQYSENSVVCHCGHCQERTSAQLDASHLIADWQTRRTTASSRAPCKTWPLSCVYVCAVYRINVFAV